MAVREVTLLAAGGTISSVEGAAGRPGASPVLDAAGLVAGLPVSVEARSIKALNGTQLRNEDALDIAQAAAGEAEGGRGVAVPSGTHTTEELAVLWHALTGYGPPVIVTGAIRPASAHCADGPANV